jgi:hypothetical protein
VKLAFGDGALAKEAGGDNVFAAHVIGEREADRQRKSPADNGVATVEITLPVEKMHGATAATAAALLLAIHFGERGFHRHSAHERMAMLAIGRNDSIAFFEHRNHTDGDRLLAVVKMKKTPDLLLRIKFGTFVLKLTDTDHLLQEIQFMRPRQMWFVTHCSSLSSVDRSPCGRPSSRAFKSRRMILPLRVFGRFLRKAISFGAIAGPKRLRA